MSDQHPMPLRLTSTLVLSIVFLAASAWADYQVGMDAYERGNYATALSEWRPLAEEGDAQAQLHLGLLYANGDDVQQDYTKARQWYEKAAAQGYAMAQSNHAGAGRPLIDSTSARGKRSAMERLSFTGQSLLVPAPFV